jgi:hypothetical protein
MTRAGYEKPAKPLSLPGSSWPAFPFAGADRSGSGRRRPGAPDPVALACRPALGGLGQIGARALVKTPLAGA